MNRTDPRFAVLLEKLLHDAVDLVPTDTEAGQLWHHRFQAFTVQRKMTLAQGEVLLGRDD